MRSQKSIHFLKCLFPSALYGIIIKITSNFAIAISWKVLLRTVAFVANVYSRQARFLVILESNTQNYNKASLVLQIIIFAESEKDYILH